ncbi:hypothetical protein O6H91_22G051200 [Diphasiastrum complanatum]|uniref:Uncharacterized protein n=1 Tax=Diphasiastrum complanatum TaxID=34168 RepID=A0ACC2AFC7_DIPCM|nr:hypothetical protein O6H91_22G051200 [Diphasiastrum complanatum]
MMFYTNILLAKDSPLRAAWIAAHLERRLCKNQITEINIVSTVEMILSSEIPIALRLSAHLLLGVVKIFSRKVIYHLQDCHSTVSRFKQVITDEVLRLPVETWHSDHYSLILCEGINFDELQYIPEEEGCAYRIDSAEHHVRSHDQITLQDPIEESSYAALQFGLDERFPDGGTQHMILIDEELLLTSQPCATMTLQITLQERFLLPDKSLKNLQPVPRCLGFLDLYEQDPDGEMPAFELEEMNLGAETTSSALLKYTGDSELNQCQRLQVASGFQVQPTVCILNLNQPQSEGEVSKCDEKMLIEQNLHSPACSLGEIYELGQPSSEKNLEQQQAAPNGKTSYTFGREDTLGEVIDAPADEKILTIELIKGFDRCTTGQEDEGTSNLITSESLSARCLLMAVDDHEILSSITVGTPALQVAPSLMHTPTSGISNSPSKSLKRRLFFEDSSQSCHCSPQGREFLGTCDDPRVWKVRRKLDTCWTGSRMPGQCIHTEEAFSKLSIHGLCGDLERFYYQILNCSWGKALDRTYTRASKKKTLIHCHTLQGADTGEFENLQHYSDSATGFMGTDVDGHSLGIKSKFIIDEAITLQSDCDSPQGIIRRKLPGTCDDQRVRKVRRKLDTCWNESRMPEKLTHTEETFSKLSIHGLCHELERFYHRILNCSWGKVHGRTDTGSSKKKALLRCHSIQGEVAVDFENLQHYTDSATGCMDIDVEGGSSMEVCRSPSGKTTPPKGNNQQERPTAEQEEIAMNKLQDGKTEAIQCLDQALMFRTETRGTDTQSSEVVGTDIQSSEAIEVCDGQDTGKNSNAYSKTMEWEKCAVEQPTPPVEAETVSVTGLSSLYSPEEEAGNFVEENDVGDHNISGWSVQTREVAQLLQVTLEGMKHSTKDSENFSVMQLSLENMLQGKTKQGAAQLFFEILVLKTRNFISVKQENAYGDILITAN